jgi:hypothetical protein
MNKILLHVLQYLNNKTGAQVILAVLIGLCFIFRCTSFTVSAADFVFIEKKKGSDGRDYQEIIDIF